MTRDKTTSIERLRRVGRMEAVSFLLLLFVAMPLKHMGELPIATKLVGWPHGLLFIVYVYLLAEVAGEHKLPLRLTLGLFVAALLPFGPFVAERYLPEPSSSHSRG